MEDNLENIIELKNVSKKYKIFYKEEGLKNSVKDFFFRKYAYKNAVSDLDLTVKSGEIIGLLGKNGAGKTTTLKMLTGILHPSSGEIQVMGYKPFQRERDFLKSICFVMGNKSDVNWDLPAIDSFRYQQLIYEIDEINFDKNLTFLTALLGVQKLLNIQIRRLSLGERMKMELINNFIYTPELIFLDEPTIGLDLESQITIRKFIKAYAKANKATVIVTSHYMDDIEEICQRIVILDEGKKTFDCEIEKIVNGDISFKETIYNIMKKEDK